MSLSTTINVQRLLAEQIEDDEWDEVVTATEILEERIWIDDRAGLSISQLRIQSREMVQKHNVDLIIVDYIDLMQPETAQGRYENKGQNYREISRGLKVIARELNISVLALAQISRRVRRSLGERPRVLDAQDSSIENDADVVMYVHREDMRDYDTTLQNIADIIVTKHRNGIREEISLYCDPRSGRFRDLMRNSAPPDIEN